MYTPCVRTSSRSLGESINLDAFYLDNPLTDLGQNDNKFQVLVTISAWVSLLMDSPLDPVKPRRASLRFLGDLCAFRSTVSFYSSLCDQMLTGLRISKGAIVSPFLPAFKRTPVFREYLEFYRTGSPACLRFLLSFLTFAKKNGFVDDQFESTALCEWTQREITMRDSQLPVWAPNLKKIFSHLFSGFKFSRDILPSHGNGAVSERGVVSAEDKNLVLTRTIGDAIVNIYDGNHRRFYDSVTSVLPLLFASSTGSARTLRPSRLMFVPKDYKSVRSICMEPTAVQWLQQGLRVQLEHHFTKHTFIKRCVRLSDQGLNRSGSMFGSYTGRTATIDLSAASDSVRWDLIKAVFPPHISFHLSASRSSSVELPNGDNFDIMKFAPMGSSLCFPIQCMVYLGVLLYIGICQTYALDYREIGCLDDLEIRPQDIFTHSPNFWGVIDNRFHLPTVYGDDIIADVRMTSNTMNALCELGFSVNWGKSFVSPDSPVRESCGKYHFIGYDVTPFRLKLPVLSEKGLSLSHLSSVVDNSNLAMTMGYWNCGEALRRVALHHPLFNCSRKFNGLSFSSKPGPFELYSIVPNNSHLRTRFNPSLFRMEVKGLTPRTSHDVTMYIDDNYHYIRSWRSANAWSEGSHSESSVHKVARKLRATMAWKPIVK